MAPSIPDRWIPYKAVGKVIEGTRIVCFKVPLKKSVQIGNKEITQIWDIKTLVQTVKNLGAVIDLTNTSRYYDPKELQAAGVLHKKILMPGRVIPPENKVQEFMDAVDEFLGKDCVAVQVKRTRLGLSTGDFLIGVHCTHGLNRTGYMVCRYMRDRLGIPAKDAIKKFETARGYQIERENYIADLLNKTPPEPDIGKDTEIKPVQESRKDSYTYKSPLDDDEYDDNVTSSRFGPTRNNRRFRREEVDDRVSYNRRDRMNGSRSQDNDRKEYDRRNNERRRRDLDRPYDYKHDY